MTPTELQGLKKRVHAVLATALAVSVAANITATEPTVVGRAVGAWSPIALLLVVDVIGRAPIATGWLGRLSLLASGTVAVVAAVASFTHMQHVARAAGESQLVAVLFPLSVDGLAIVASVALVEINRQLKIWQGSEPAPTLPTVPGPATPTPTPARARRPINDRDAGQLTSIAPAGAGSVPVFSATGVNGSRPNPGA